MDHRCVKSRHMLMTPSPQTLYFWPFQSETTFKAMLQSSQNQPDHLVILTHGNTNVSPL